MLEKNLMNYKDDHSSANWLFQHDKCLSQVSRNTREWFEMHEGKRMQWTSRSTDLNPIENLWSVLTSNF